MFPYVAIWGYLPHGEMCVCILLIKVTLVDSGSCRHIVSPQLTQFPVLGNQLHKKKHPKNNFLKVWFSYGEYILEENFPFLSQEVVA